MVGAIARDANARIYILYINPELAYAGISFAILSEHNNW